MPVFIKNARDIAHSAMVEVDRDLANRFACLIEFLTVEPGAVSRKSSDFGTEAYIVKQAIA